MFNESSCKRPGAMSGSLWPHTGVKIDADAGHSAAHLSTTVAIAAARLLETSARG